MRIAIVGRRTDRSGNMRSMIVFIEGISVVVDRVYSIKIVHKSVFVIVDAVPGNLIEVAPHLLHQISMGVTNAGVDDRNNHTSGTSGQVPRPDHIYIRSRNTSRFSRIAN